MLGSQANERQKMTVHAPGMAMTPTQNIDIRKHPYGLILASVGGVILLGCAIYALMVLQNMGAKMEALPRMAALLTSTNDRLTAISSQMEQVGADMKKLPPLLTQVNENVQKIAPPLKLVNHNVQGTAPTLQRMDGRLTVTNQRLNTVQQKLDTLRQSIDRMEETTHRLRKVLPR